MSSSTEESRSVVEKMYAAGEAGDVDGMLACLSEDVVVHEPPFLPYGGDHRGRDGFVELFTTIDSYLDMTRVVVDRLVADGPWVVAVMRIPDRRTGQEVLLCDELHVSGGIIDELRIYFHDAQSLVGERPR